MVLITLPIIIFTAWIIDKYVDKISISAAAKIAKHCVVKLQLSTRINIGRILSF